MGSLFGNIARAVTRSPITKIAASFIPGASAALTVGSLATTAYGAYQAMKTPAGMPALPSLGGMPTGGGFAGGLSPYAGKTGIFQNDPNVKGRPDIEAAAISKANLRVCYRSPQRGYVVVKDSNGDPMAIPKAMAKQYYGWRPAKKPLLSIRDTNAIRRAGTAIKKLQRAEKMAKKIANWHSPHRAAPRNIVVTGRTVSAKRIAA